MNNIVKIVLLVLAIDSVLVGVTILWWIPHSKTATLATTSGASPVEAVSSAVPTQSTASGQSSVFGQSQVQSQAIAATVPVSSLRQSMTVEQAYQRIPHSRTPFPQTQAAGMTAAEAQAASAMFYWSDRAVVERMAQVDAISQRQPYSSENYGVILSQLNALSVPETLAAPKQLIVSAIQEQKAYIEGLARQSQRMSPEDPLVQSSHQKLVAAYGQLMQSFPQISETTKKSFFDHLCTLDFI
jgi:hypothetical protein